MHQKIVPQTTDLTDKLNIILMYNQCRCNFLCVTCEDWKTCTWFQLLLVMISVESVGWSEETIERCLCVCVCMRGEVSEGG